MGRHRVRTILTSSWRSNTMFSMVAPTIASNKLALSQTNVPRLNRGQRALMKPAMPVNSNKPVWGLLVSAHHG